MPPQEEELDLGLPPVREIEPKKPLRDPAYTVEPEGSNTEPHNAPMIVNAWVDWFKTTFEIDPPYTIPRYMGVVKAIIKARACSSATVKQALIIFTFRYLDALEHGKHLPNPNQLGDIVFQIQLANSPEGKKRAAEFRSAMGRISNIQAKKQPARAVAQQSAIDKIREAKQREGNVRALRASNRAI